MISLFCGHGFSAVSCFLWEIGICASRTLVDSPRDHVFSHPAGMSFLVFIASHSTRGPVKSIEHEPGGLSGLI